jgi:hypothetical protein
MLRERIQQPIEIQAHFFEKRQAIFNKLDQEIFNEFINLQNEKLKGSKLWIGQEYTSLLESQRSEWNSEKYERMHKYFKDGALEDPENMPMGSKWSFNSLKKAVQNGMQQRKEDDPEGYAEV